MSGEALTIETALSQLSQSIRFQQDFSPLTTAAYMSDLRIYLDDPLVHALPDSEKFDPATFNSYIKRGQESGLALATLKRKTSAFRTILNELGIANSPLEVDNRFPGLTPSLRQYHPKTALTQLQEERLYEVSATQPRDQALFALALGTGAKPSEIIGLNTENISTIKGDNLESAARVDFSATSQRVVTMTGQPAQIVLDYSQGWPVGRPLFTRLWGEEKHDLNITRQGIWLVAKRYGPLIDRPDLTPTTFRATYIARLSHQNSRRQVAEALGIKAPANARIWLTEP